MSRRLESVEETRRKITAAAFDLHATIGPSRTTIQAIADGAGVQRHTVYAHFPDLDSLYLACTEHGIRATGMPMAEPWLVIADPVERLRFGLSELFSWYRTNERMLRNVLYDLDPTVPPPTEPDIFDRRMTALYEALTDGWRAVDEGARPTQMAMVAHAMAFETWRSLSSAGLTDDQVVELLAAIVDGIVTGTIDTTRDRSPWAP